MGFKMREKTRTKSCEKKVTIKESLRRELKVRI